MLSLLFITLTHQAHAKDAHNAHEHANADTAQTLSLNQGRKWQIDDSLHQGMTQIKHSIEANINPIHHNTFSPEQYVKLAQAVEQGIHFIFQHCKLPTAADAQLHILLIAMIDGHKKMQSGEQQRQGAIMIIKALNKYPQYFDDENWQAINH